MTVAEARTLSLSAAFAFALFGCASGQPDNPATNAEAVAPLTCASKEQCDVYWQRAQAWVVSTSSYRIQLANDTVIQTYGPFGSKVDTAYKIVKVPEGKNGARIYITPACDNIFRCYPTLTDAVISFKRFVRQDDAPSSPNTGAQTAAPKTSSKYAYTAEQFAKANSCESPVATLNFVSAGAETFGVVCGKSEPMVIRCEYGQCRVLK